MDAKYSKFLEQNMDRIRNKVLGKYGVDNVSLGAQPKRGRLKDEKSHLVCEAFGLNIFTLRVWRSGKCKAGRQRLYALLMAMPFDVLDHILEMELKQ